MSIVTKIPCAVTGECGSTSRQGAASVSYAPVYDQPAPDSSGPLAPTGANQSGCGALQWFVLRHRPTEGRQAATRIRALGFQSHHFREEVTRRAYEDVLRAYFPGYLFARFALGDSRWGHIMRLSPVTGILCSNFGHPVAVPDEAMAMVCSQFDDRDIFIPKTPPAPASKIGMKFSVQVGPWARFLGECVGEDPKGRVKLLMTLFGRSSVQEFRPEQLTEATNGSP